MKSIPKANAKFYRANLEKQIAALNQEIADIKSNAIYKNAFEWRFEFPEVLDNDGNFTGFDIVIGNPPYIRQEELGTLKDYLKKGYQVYSGMADILVYFYELGINLFEGQRQVFFHHFKQIYASQLRKGFEKSSLATKYL